MFSRPLVRDRRRVLLVVAVLAALPLPKHPPLRLIPVMMSLILRAHISRLLMRLLKHHKRLGLLRKMKMMKTRARALVSVPFQVAGMYPTFRSMSGLSQSIGRFVIRILMLLLLSLEQIPGSAMCFRPGYSMS